MANEFVIRIRADDAATATVNKIKNALSKVTDPVEKSQKRIGKLGDVGQAGLSKLRKGLSGAANAASSLVDKIVEIVPGLTAIGGAASLAGLTALATKFGTFGFNLNKSSKLLGMNAQDLASWHVAAKRAGVSADQFDSAMSGSQMTIRAAAFGADPHAMMLLQKMGVQIQRNKDGTIDYYSTQMRLMKAIEGQKSVEAQRDVAGTFGMGSLLPMLQQGTYGADKARAFRKGLVPTAEEVERAAQFHRDINDLEDSVTGLGSSIGSRLIPILDPLVNGFAKWLDAHRAQIADKISGAVQKLADWISKIDWDSVATKAKSLWDNLGGVKGVAIAIAAIKFAGPISGVLSLIANLTRLSAVVLPAAVLQMGLLTAAAFAAESARQKALDGVIAAGPNHDQYVADAQAGGVVTPEVDGAHNEDLGGRFFRWMGSIGTNNATSAKDVVAQMQGQGWSRNAAEGIAANLWAESKFDPTAVGDNGHAYGIGQWHEDRQALFKKWAGHDIQGSSLTEQLKFVDYELRNGDAQSQLAGRSLPLVHSADAAGRIVSQFYERPADVAGEARRRGALAGAINSSMGDAGSDQVAGATDHDANVAAMRGAAPSGHDAQVSAMQSAAPQITLNVHNALPGTRVEAKSPDGGYLPTKVNYALRGADGAAP